MGHRRSVYSSQIPEMDHAQIRNYPNSHPHLHSENGFHRLPVNGAVTEVNSMLHVNPGLRVMDNPSSFSAEIPNYGVGNSGISHDFCLQTSSAGSSSRFFGDYTQYRPYYNHLAIGDESTTMNHHINEERAVFKRKNPVIHPVFERKHVHGCYSTPSSSNPPFLADQIEPKSLSGPHCWSWNPINMVPRGDHVSTSSEEFQRNVRRRHGHAIHLESSLDSAYQPENLPCHVHSSGSASGVEMAGELSHDLSSLASDRRILSLGTGSFGHETNQFLVGSSVARGTIETDGAFHVNLTQKTDPSISTYVPAGPSIQGIGQCHGIYSQRTAFHRAASSYPSVGFASTSLEDAMHSGVEAITSSRRSRPLSIVEHGRQRNGRARNYYDGVQFLLNGNARSRWASEGAVMIDQSTFYDSMEMFDEYRDMRLDVDDMSYEELLVLEERIGSVSTGLSEETISRCLVEMFYHSSNWTQDDQDEDKCVICLEEYREGEGLGRLKCGHDFHVRCIREWLLIKNVCPICKAAALSDASKEKQIVSY